MDSLSLLRAERARRGHDTALVTLAALAQRAGITRRALLYQMRRGALDAMRVPWRGSRWQWVVTPEEAERFLRTYRWNARTATRRRPSAAAA